MPAISFAIFARVHWLAFFGTVLLCWALLYAMSIPADWRSAEQSFGAALIAMICGDLPGYANYPQTVAMWALMSAAMMAPSAFPAFRTYDELGSAAPTNLGRLVSGYLLVWFGFSIFAAAAQLSLANVGLVGMFGQSQSAIFSASLLFAAGLYQFSPLKEACLSRCRAPLTFFMQNWSEGPFRNGVRLGLVCMGCCWALMLLGFVGGTMNLAFMGLAMILMTIEKLPEIGRYLTRPLGGTLILAGIYVAVF